MHGAIIFKVNCSMDGSNLRNDDVNMTRWERETVSSGRYVVNTIYAGLLSKGGRFCKVKVFLFGAFPLGHVNPANVNMWIFLLVRINPTIAVPN